MFKLCVVLAFVAVATASPAPKAEAKANPGLLAAAYTAPVVAAPLAAAPLAAYSAYSAAAYTAPFGYVAPAVLNAGYTAYSPYSGSLVVV